MVNLARMDLIAALPELSIFVEELFSIMGSELTMLAVAVLGYLVFYGLVVPAAPPKTKHLNYEIPDRHDDLLMGLQDSLAQSDHETVYAHWQELKSFEAPSGLLLMDIIQSMEILGMTTETILSEFSSVHDVNPAWFPDDVVEELLEKIEKDRQHIELCTGLNRILKSSEQCQKGCSVSNTNKRPLTEDAVNRLGRFPASVLAYVFHLSGTAGAFSLSMTCRELHSCIWDSVDVWQAVLGCNAFGSAATLRDRHRWCCYGVDTLCSWRKWPPPSARHATALKGAYRALSGLTYRDPPHSVDAAVGALGALLQWCNATDDIVMEFAEAIVQYVATRPDVFSIENAYTLQQALSDLRVLRDCLLTLPGEVTQSSSSGPFPVLLEETESSCFSTHSSVETLLEGCVRQRRKVHNRDEAAATCVISTLQSVTAAQSPASLRSM